MRISITSLVSATAAASVLMAQTPDTVNTKLRASAAESQAAATSGLAEFKRLVSGKNFQSYGFASADEAASATLGQPVVVFLVRLDQLRDYQPTTDASRLLSGGDKVLYPVLAGGQVRSSVVVDKGSNGWKAGAFGGAQLIQRLSQARARISPAATPIAVDIPALGAYVLGELRGGQVFLTPLADHPELNLKAGATEQAAQVFTQLAPVARTHNGLPR